MFGFGGKSFNIKTDIPDCSGKTIIVTGGNIGLGRATCEAIASHNPGHIYLGARSAEKASATIQEIQKSHPNVSISFLECDLADLGSVEAAARKFTSESQRLDILFCNAGVMALPAGLSKSGYEMQFGTNHVGHALLIKLLLPTLERTAQMPGSDVRIVSLSSLGHNLTPTGGIVFDTLKTDQKDIHTWSRYGQSKLANILYVKALAKRYPNIKCVAVHPGFVATNLATTVVSGNYFYKVAMTAVSFIPGVMKTANQGALNQLWAAFTPKDALSTGEYYEPVGVPGKGSKLSQDPKLSEKLWDWTESELQTYSAAN